ncbi:hypothetical protein SAMN04515671_2697 [Nakamurella panacisegetis]|uniref:Lipoprotein LpqN n=1 Tax=Nakamurella panacisegetis TaxID=1090615 RepID=A0A1H0PBZ8_9ACTN|nr:hypothetical protein [Nakamurella panacisegetis]SDP02178.1 hypothetical protein SAMN04515671_2697 [Nakamurella panacisegetis]
MSNSTIRFPSEDFPALPAVSLVLPEEWSGVVVPATVLAAHRRVDEGQFVSNVIVRTQRVENTVDLQTAAAIVDEGVASLADVQDIGRAIIETAGRNGYAREFAFRHAEAGTLAQSWRIFVVEHDGVTDLVELVGTVSPARTLDLAEIRSIMDTALIGDRQPAVRS